MDSYAAARYAFAMMKDSERHKKRPDPAEREARLIAFLQKADRWYGRMLAITCTLFVALLAASFAGIAYLAVPLIVLFLLFAIPTMFLILANKLIRFAAALRRLFAWLTRQERL